MKTNNFADNIYFRTCINWGLMTGIFILLFIHIVPFYFHLQGYNKRCKQINHVQIGMAIGFTSLGRL